MIFGVLWSRSKVGIFGIPDVNWNHGLRGRQPPAKAKIRLVLIVASDPTLRQHLRLKHGVKLLAILFEPGRKANKNGHRDDDRFVWLPLLDSNQRHCG